MSSPLIATAVGHMVKKHNRHRFLRKLNQEAAVNSGLLQEDLEELKALGDSATSESAPFMGKLSQRLAVYTSEGELFKSDLDQETKQARIRSKVAIQSNIFGPILGAATLTQGILKTIAYYGYRRLPTAPANLRVADRLYYSGAVVGLPGAAASFGITAYLLAGSLHYQHQLAREKRLPRHLLEQRLAHLDEVQKEVNACFAYPAR